MAPTAPTATRIVAVAGAGQEGPTGMTLPVPLEVMVVDRAGAPVSGVTVYWRRDINVTSITPAQVATDSVGRAHARVTLGEVPGQAQVTALLPGIDSSAFVATVRTADNFTRDNLDNPVVPLRLATFDGSGEVVHPDHVFTPADRFGTGRQLAATPYPGGNAAFELPSVFGGTQHSEWAVQAGAPNPVIAAPATGYMSDPDIVYVPDLGEVWLYYRQVTSQNIIHVVRSSDGVHWGPPVRVLAAENHRIVSPTVVYRKPGDWWMWAVDASTAGCTAAATQVVVRRSADGLTWSSPRVVDLPSRDGLSAWHIDVEWLPSRQEFWALYNVKNGTGCATPAVVLATSPDGLVWTPATRPVLVKGAIPEFQDIVYRSSFEYDSLTDDVTFWFSGARFNGTTYQWNTAVQRRHRADLFGRSGIQALRKRMGRAAPVELLDGP